MRFKKLFIVVTVLLLAVVVYPQSGLSVLDKKTIDTFVQEISGGRAKDYVYEISRYHRIRGGGPETDYEKAVEYVVSELKKGGIENVEVFKYPCNGIKKYETYPSPIGFKVRSAKLYLKEPAEELWCDYSKTAVSLMAYSNGGYDEGEVVYVGRGISEKDYEGKEVKGKIVFAERTDVTRLMREAVIKRGALGIIAGFSARPDRYQYPDLVEQHRIYITGEEAEDSKWGFTLSYRQTERLKKLLRINKRVVMRAEVDAKLFEGYMPVISAVIKGEKYPDQEILYMAHLDHYKPGANDNASGSAGLIEIATVLKKLIAENKIDKPKRTIRFLWVPEIHGTAAYILDNYDTVKKGICGINMDMIGENYTECNSNMIISSTPLSIPSFLDALLKHFAGLIDRLPVRTQIGTNNIFNYRILPYIGGSDHVLFNDSNLNVPSVMIVHSDRFHHTSYDTPDKVDPTEMKRSILLGLFTGWTVANYDIKQARNIVEIVYNYLTKKVEDYTTNYLEVLENSDNNDIHRNRRNIKTYFSILKEYGEKDIESVLRYVENANQNILKDNINLFKAYVDIQKTRMNNYYRELCRTRNIRRKNVHLNSFEKECSQIYPKRNNKIPLSYDMIYSGIPDNKIFKFETLNYQKIQEMINFIDSKANMIYIRNAVSAEFGEIDLRTVKDLFDILKEKGYVSY